jgi:hypothetical protein
MLFGMRQGPEEDILDYFMSIRKVIYKVDPNMRQADQVQKMISGSTEKWQKFLYGKKPKTLDRVLELIRKRLAL